MEYGMHRLCTDQERRGEGVEQSANITRRRAVVCTQIDAVCARGWEQEQDITVYDLQAGPIGDDDDECIWVWVCEFLDNEEGNTDALTEPAHTSRKWGPTTGRQQA